MFNLLTPARRRSILRSPDGVGSAVTGGSSLDDIAASMLSSNTADAHEDDKKQAGVGGNSQPARPDSSRRGQGAQQIEEDDGEEDDGILGSAQGRDDDDDDDDQPDDNDGDDVLDGIFGDTDDAADQDGADDDEDEPLDTSKLGDDVKLSVTVDGEEQEVTLGELKRRYAGEGAIEKRLQQATEARKSATETYQNSTQLTKLVMENFGQLLFRRTVPQPDEKLAATNPGAYLQQQRRYEQEGQALQQAQAQLHGLMSQLDQQNMQMQEQIKQEAVRELRRIMPAIADPVKGPKLRDALITAAKEIGYSDEMIAGCTDPLMFKTMALAARELKRMKGASVQKQKEPQRTMKKSAKSKNHTSQQRREQTAAARAAKTGAVDDVAAMLITTPRRNKGRV